MKSMHVVLLQTILTAARGIYLVNIPPLIPDDYNVPIKRPGLSSFWRLGIF